MTTALSQRAALRGLFLIIDSRRGVLERDEELIAWASAADCPVHVLLSKSDKLKRAELARTLAAAQHGAGRSRHGAGLFGRRRHRARASASATASVA